MENSESQQPKPSLSIPKSDQSSTLVSSISPKTPADEGIEFFQSPIRLGEEPIKAYELRLDVDGGPPENLSYIRLPPACVPYILRVSIAAGTPAARNGLFITNFPLDGGVFARDRFASRKLPTDYSKPIQVDLPISHAGAFVYWVEYDDGSGKRIQGRKGYFNIDPILKTKARASILHPRTLKPLLPAQGGAVIKNEYVSLPLNALSILSIVSKWMGPISDWKKYFDEASQRGYNMLHFTPLQERGHSDSPFSLRNQMKYDTSLGATDASAFEEILCIARDEYGLLSLTDVVLNHTADDTPWLREHPEVGYSPANCPHLRPAFELDSAMIEFSGLLAEKGLPMTITSDADVDILVTGLQDFTKGLRLWEYYIVDVAYQRSSVREKLFSGKCISWDGPDLNGKPVGELAKLLLSQGRIECIGALASRFCVKIDSDIAASLVSAAFGHLTDPDMLADAWVQVVDAINMPLYREWEEDTRVAFDLMKGRIKYLRLDEAGPRLGQITKENPLVETYFTRVAPTADADPFVYSLANNGWLWNSSPMQNFAMPPSKAYLRREVISWRDCVKLRYGSSPSDNPWLWAHMKGYVTSLARTFDGFRIDNCHSTPLEVGTYMLDAARAVKPDLYVCAELFTGDEEMDLLFVRELGVNSLIREAYNAHDPKELSRIIYRFGIGKPVGSMDAACLTNLQELRSPTGKGPVRPCIVDPLSGSLPHALFYDQTHDNESPLHKRSAEDALSTAALVAFSYCANGSVKGFDDLYPKLLNLVTEKRQYEITGLGEQSGMAKVKRVLNLLHREMMLGEYVEGHVHQENDYIVVHRIQPFEQKGYLLVAHTAFSKGSKDRGYIEPIRLSRTRARFIMGTSIEILSEEVEADDQTIRGLPSKLLEIPPIINQGAGNESDYTEIVVPEYFPPGSIMVFETQLQGHDQGLDAYCSSGAQEAFAELDFVHLNVMLYRADGEERDATEGKYGSYVVPGLGKLVYCGLEGWMHPLRSIVRNNDLGHPLCAHLRHGTWAFSYIHERLTCQVDLFPRLQSPAQWLKERFDRIAKNVPHYLRPKYFALVVYTAYTAARGTVIELTSEFVASGHSFTHNLAMCAVQMYGFVKSTSLDPGKLTPSLAAGLPHFAAGWARCWGRDVFISLRGLLLTTGNFSAAKGHILAFASTLKHGLIPNLLDSVRNPRYNSRDSPWWMLQSIQDYVNRAPSGLSILSESVNRRFPQDDSWVAWDDPRAYSYASTLAEIVQEILQRHAMGLNFREYNAGPNLDMQMREEGFNVDVRVDWETGFIMGGNRYNCGTWMDKMGESQKAGSKGVPGTPRDGAPVEITGLLFSALRWLDELSDSGKFPFRGVCVQASRQDGAEAKLLTYGEWANLIKTSFEKCYYVPLDPADDIEYRVNSGIVNRRGIYKDVYGSGAGREWSDYQFRPNFLVAMTVAPELFDVNHAVGALKLADEVLRGPLGMKTLDPIDFQYRPIYDNSNDGDDPAIAKGLNYHNGPEWGWPLGYFLRAYLHFLTVGERKKDSESVMHYLHGILLAPRRYIETDPWAGLPELTNENGAYCRDSCNTQAWSASTLLDFLETVHRRSSGELSL